MRTKRIIKRLLLLILLAIISFGVYYAWYSFPIISGFSAKNACSCAFIQGRDKSSINNEELSSFPLSIGTININYKDSSVTGSVWGTAKRKAIFREGFGCTLVNEISENELRRQKFPLAVATVRQDTVAWPIGDLVSKTVIQNPLLDSAIAFAFNHQFLDKDVNTRALLVVHKDSIITERYAKGYHKNSKFLGWSMAKSVTAALVGVLVQQGKLRIDQPAPVAQWRDQNDKRHKI